MLYLDDMSDRIIVKNDYKENIRNDYKELQDIIKNNVDLNIDLFRTDVQKRIFINELSYGRRNIVSSMNLNKEMSVLEVNSGFGAGTKYIQTYVSSLTCVDESLIKTKIKYESSNLPNSCITYVGNINSCLEKLNLQFDCIIVWEMQNDGLDMFLSNLKRLIRKNGEIYIFTSNKYGVENIANMRKSKDGQYHLLHNRNLMAKRVIEKKVLEYFDNFECYYPYPSYNYTMMLYSDEHLPKIGELDKNRYKFSSEYIHLEDELSLFNMIIEDGLFDMFSNSYMFVLKGK